MTRYFANFMMRLAFRAFRRYHNYLPEAVTKEGIIWGEINRKPRDEYYTIHHLTVSDHCSTCVRELEEDRARQRTIQKWLKGETR